MTHYKYKSHSDFIYIFTTINGEQQEVELH